MTDPVEADEMLLLSYLDNEIGASERRDVESRLASDEAFHRKLVSLEESWRSLDILNVDVKDQEFFSTTMELTAVNAQKDIESLRRENKHSTKYRWAALISVFIFVSSVTYWSVTLVFPDPVISLLEDVPVIENLDYYQPVGSFEFLLKLDKSGLFEIKEKSQTPNAPHEQP